LLLERRHHKLIAVMTNTSKLKVVTIPLRATTLLHLRRACLQSRQVGVLFLAFVWGCNPAFIAASPAESDINQFMVVDCLLPAQIRRLGNMTYAAARRAIKTNTAECEARGGEYVAYDRASSATTLKVWLPLAEEGDAEAQTYVGETYEKGLGIEPDYALAAYWYLTAAEQGFSRAAINLGNLFELGLGLDKDLDMARFWYRQASGEGIQPLLETQYEPPKILIIEPELSQRGISIDAKGPTNRSSDAPILVIGQIQTEMAINQVTLNGKPAGLVGNALFRGTVSPANGRIEVIVLDEQTRETRLTITTDGSTYFAASSSGEASQKRQIADPIADNDQLASVPGKGNYHALVIGNNGYQVLPQLDTAVSDAKAVATVLRQQYNFSVKIMVDVNRYALLSALNDFRKKLDPEDHLLVYYAGHGELDRVNKRGSWLPIDAEPDSPANWISNVAITDLLNTLPPRQILVIADSCYSGMMSRSALGVIDRAMSQAQRQQQLRTLAGARTRTAFTSGGVAPVLDGIGGANSVFATELLTALQQNKGAVTGYDLFRAVAPQVADTVSKVGFVQEPEYAPLKFAGHEAGDFVFYKTSH